MSKVLEQLVKLLDLKAIETNVFVGNSQDLGFKSLFGGQVLGQALVAASRTVEAERPIHSLHGYFLRAGKPNEPIYYEVDLIRSGKSFSTRRVVAKQGGLAIFSMSASFHAIEKGFEHQVEKPSVPGPDGILSELEQFRKVRDKVPEPIREKLNADRPIEIRVVDPVDYFDPHKRPPLKYSWFKASGKLPDDTLTHTAMLAYASDFGLATTAMLPHGVTFFNPRVQVASLDHAMWFHRPARMDEWLLYVKDSPSAAGGRGFNRGQIFDKNGILVASVAQESLIRGIDPPSPQDSMKGLVT
ncbi:MAG TPA: acyl-CoA thioesterase II [Oligoflexus sp.]|uniref:acyl-CoA thioesterase n=1 Tax=Oligoflexus sp. TaxID=1971216 RepID=UPI002D6F50CA|nr:acyl-CoA thioesterase II [Oligoflexus sp.]HYX34956.1 acyl-CoA thioesterase II [Oligoflexus sp.]